MASTSTTLRRSTRAKHSQVNEDNKPMSKDVLPKLTGKGIKRRVPAGLETTMATVEDSTSKKRKRVAKAIEINTTDEPGQPNNAVPKAEATAASRGEVVDHSSSIQGENSPPSTPESKVKAKLTKASDAVNSTKTPTRSKLEYSTSETDDTAHLPPHQHQSRPAKPHMTNALLKTPKGSRVVASMPDDTSVQPEATSPSDTSTTTANLLTKACAHLCSADPSGQLARVIEQYPCPVFSPAGLDEVVDPFQNLASGIISQQVSGAAAKSIKNKFVALYNTGKGENEAHDFPTPQAVAQTDIARLRTAGLSQRKAEYIQGLAEKFASGELSAKWLVEATDEEVMDKLIAVRGLGKWSVEMFACWGLKRMDILSTGDLGIQRGMAAFVGKDVAKLKAKGGGKWKYMSEQDMLSISEKFRPYRSLFMWYMWRIEDVDTTALANN